MARGPGHAPSRPPPRGSGWCEPSPPRPPQPKDDHGPDGDPPRRLPSRVHKSATGTTCDRPNCQRTGLASTPDATGRSDLPRIRDITPADNIKSDASAV